MVDVVVTNPPFGGAEEEGIELNFPQGFRTRETADLFLLLIMKTLRDGGRCGIVLPDGGVLSGEGVERNIREKLLTDFNLHTVIRLPAGVFNPYTSIRTNLLFFEKGKTTTNIWYFEHPLPEGYKTYNKSKPMQISEFDLEKRWWENRDADEFKRYCWKVTKEDAIKRNYNLDISNPNSTGKIESLSKEDVINSIHHNLERTKELLNMIKKAF